MIILPFFPKRGCWNLSKSHLLSIRISRIKVLKSGNYSQKKNKTKRETSDGRCELLWKNLYVVASRLLGDEMTVNPIIHSKSERSKVKQT